MTPKERARRALEIHANITCAGIAADERLNELGFAWGESRRTARHEAAHCVVAYIRGRWPGKATIVLTDETYGHMFVAGESAVTPELAVAETASRTLLGGSGRGGDRRRALLWCILAVGSWRGARAEFRARLSEARSFVRGNWPLIEHVAALLIKKQTIDAVDFCDAVMDFRRKRLEELKAMEAAA